jgi:hypothetical protein
MTIKIITAPALAWYNSWKGHEFEIDPKAPHDEFYWCVMELPPGENGEAPEGWFKVRKSDCKIVKE